MWMRGPTYWVSKNVIFIVSNPLNTVICQVLLEMFWFCYDLRWRCFVCCVKTKHINILWQLYHGQGKYLFVIVRSLLKLRHLDCGAEQKFHHINYLNYMKVNDKWSTTVARECNFSHAAIRIIHFSIDFNCIFYCISWTKHDMLSREQTNTIPKSH